jgi:Zn finger protein HypA/HybF involved in hydrogenase expression
MTNEELLKKRKETADLIIEHYENFMVCEGCDCILKIQTIFCPSCNAYRFDKSKERIIEQAIKLGSKLPENFSKLDWK